MSQTFRTFAASITRATHAHAGQFGCDGQPYITHPLRVMLKMATTHQKIVAVLHDVLEDTPTTTDDLQSDGLSEDLIRSVQSVTAVKGEPYHWMILRANDDPIGRVVKLADLEDNFNLPRTLVRVDRLDSDLDRLKRYALSHQFLRGDLGLDDYLTAMGAA